MEVSVRDIPQGAQLIDVREADEYAEVHALGAISIPMSEFTVRLNEVDTEQDVYVICKSGGRSARVVEYLVARDIKAINVAGGTDDWVEAGLPTE
ncbi:sulfurtransferase [Corynebacterium ulcerans]|nr:rhodanese-like domain-containing protein [Corynebacterium ulcerans]OAG69673.1 sulfurtransferase [Corynebacterium ulcerans]